jgi:hypothetical protein
VQIARAKATERYAKKGMAEKGVEPLTDGARGRKPLEREGQVLVPAASLGLSPPKLPSLRAQESGPGRSEATG